MNELKGKYNGSLKFHPIADLFPMMEGDEFDNLVADISKNGLLEPIWIYDNSILDGRNRYMACKAAEVEPSYREYKGDDPLSFAVAMNIERRHLTPSQRACLAVEILPFYEHAARERRKRKPAGFDTEKIPYQNNGEAREFAAAIVHVNPRYVSDAKALKEEAPQLFAEMKGGQIHMREAQKEARKLRKYEQQEELVKLADTVEPSDRCNIFAGDIRNVELDFYSLDAIITDPPYPQDCLPLWEELGKFAQKYLKEGGVLLAMTGNLYLPFVINSLGKFLTYQWQLSCQLPGQHSEVHAAWVNNQMWKPVLVYRNGGELVNIGSDVFKNDGRDKDFHEWGQGVDGYLWQIEHFTKPNDLICDPFLGGGTTAEAALIHELYSDWHWSLVQQDPKYKRLYVSDIDRLWIEYDYDTNAVVAIIDLKWEDSNDGFTPTEKGIYEWFERVGAKYYIVYVKKDFSAFRVMNSAHRTKYFTPIEYADWLLSLRNQKRKAPALDIGSLLNPMKMGGQHG